jgi:hypothetical protein
MLRRISLISLVLVVFAPFSFSQDEARLQKLQRIEELKREIAREAVGLHLPDQADIVKAEGMNLSAARLLPRERYEGLIAVRGSGAYYSFSRRSNEYGNGTDLQLSGGQLSIGFAGADFGFMSDLGAIAIEDALKNPAVAVFDSYRPPNKLDDAREEQRRFRDGVVSGILMKNNLPVIVGNTYLLRSISYRTSDILVAFRIEREDADGSIVIFWKAIKKFPSPELSQ